MSVPAHCRSGGIQTWDAISEVDKFDAATLDSGSAGVANELRGLAGTDPPANIEVALHAFPLCVAIDVSGAGDAITTAIDTAGTSGVARTNRAIAGSVSGESRSDVRRLSARIIRSLVSRTYCSNNALDCGVMFFSTGAK